MQYMSQAAALLLQKAIAWQASHVPNTNTIVVVVVHEHELHIDNTVCRPIPPAVSADSTLQNHLYLDLKVLFCLFLTNKTTYFPTFAPGITWSLCTDTRAVKLQ